MRYNVAQLLKDPIGSARDYQLDDSFTSPRRITDIARGPVHLLRTHHGILVRATVEVRSTQACGRCLVEFDLPSTVSIEEEYFPTVDFQSGRNMAPAGLEDDASTIDSQNVLDLTEVLHECVVTDTPMKPLCSTGCLGLCQRCGANLNLAQCECGTQQEDPRWEALLGLLEK